MSDIVVIGGSVAGLAAALGLSRSGHRVTILERDDTPLPDSPVAAFERWDRRGAPQVRHSHAFLARLRNLLRDRAPDVLAALIEAGAEELDFQDLMPPEMVDRTPEPGDEDLVMLACRRITFEWVLRRAVHAESGIRLRTGCEVRGLLGSVLPDGTADVVGVRVAQAGRDEALAADLVVDAGGRRSRLSRWLLDLGAAPLQEESEDCGIFYCSRFFRLRPGATPPHRQAFVGGDLGYLKYGIFQGDAGVFSLTFAAPPEDDPLRRLLRQSPFEAAARAIPATAPWVDEATAEPITDVAGMARLMNTRRHFLRDSRPIAHGLVAVGDSAIHTNPMYGRGCTFAVVHAWLLVDAFAACGGDRRQVLEHLEAAVEREIVPWYAFTLGQDREAAVLARKIREGEVDDAPPEPGQPIDPRAYMRDLIRHGLLPALRTDPSVLRAFMRSVNVLEPPGDLMKSPDVLQRVLASYQQREGREEPELGPDRKAMLRVLEAA
ncbi:MAG: NAD-binding protein [Myxococcota bacterium]|nr:NAD-binding protein [Myxococcota bacterium]